MPFHDIYLFSISISYPGRRSHNMLIIHHRILFSILETKLCQILLASSYLFFSHHLLIHSIQTHRALPQPLLRAISPPAHKSHDLILKPRTRIHSLLLRFSKRLGGLDEPIRMISLIPRIARGMEVICASWECCFLRLMFWAIGYWDRC